MKILHWNVNTKQINSLMCFFTKAPLVFIFCCTTVFAQNKVVVIPLSGDDLKPLGNVITVAKENGDFSDPIAAMDSITDASASNPYIVVVAPGEYDLGTGQIAIQSFVSLAGSGPNITVFKSTRTSSSSGAISFSDDSSAQDLGVIVSGTSSSNQVALSAGNFIDRVTISNLNVVMDNANSAQRTGLLYRVGSAIIRDTRIEISGGSNIARGITAGFGGTSLVISDSILILPSGANSTPASINNPYCNFVRRGDSPNAPILDTNCT